MAHLVLPDTQTDPSQNQKSHFFATALTSLRMKDLS
jgi:chemotaxis receptor (MCP) glutamine deamidase CheD